MSLINALGTHLQELEHLVGSSQKDMDAHVSATASPMSKLEQARDHLPAAVDDVRGRLSDVSTTAQKAHGELSTTRDALAADSRRMREECLQKLEALERNASETRARLEALTQKVKVAETAVKEAAGHLKDEAHTFGGRLAADVQDTRGRAREATRRVDESAAAVLAAYHPAAVVEMLRLIAALATRLQSDADETLPHAYTKATDRLRNEFLEQVKTSLKAFEADTGSALERFDADAAATSEAMRERLQKAADTLDKLVAEELPQNVRTAYDKDEAPALRAMLELAATTSQVTGGARNYVKGEMDPYFPVVREIYLALRRMIGK